MKRLISLTLALVLALSGCTPPAADTSTPSASAPVETAEPTATPRPGPAVYTDYSQLGEREKVERPISKFTRRYAEFTDTLIPADDYGPLMPFPGATVTRQAEDGWGWMEDYDLYGLMTLDGEVVVDPVFSTASIPSMWDERSQQSRELDCLILQKVVRDKNGEPVDVAAVCARDGSWCTGFDYSFDWETLMYHGEDNIIPLFRRGSAGRTYDALVFFDPDTGETLRSVDLRPVLERWPDAAWSLVYNLRYGERYAIFSDDTSHYLFDSETGEVQILEELLNLLSGELEAPYGAPFYEGLCAVKTASGWGYIDGTGWVTDPIYENSYPFENGIALVRDMNVGSEFTCIDHSGRTVYTLPLGAHNVDWHGGFLCYTLKDRAYCLDQNFQETPIPDGFSEPMVNGNWFFQQLPDPSPTVPGSWAFWNVKTGARQDFPNDWEYDYSISGNYAILDSRADTHNYVLANLTTGELTELGRWSYVGFRQDELTGETYLYLSGLDGGESEWRRMDGSILYRSGKDWGWQVTFWGDRVLLAADDAATLTDLTTGELVFSWPLDTAAD